MEKLYFKTSSKPQLLPSGRQHWDKLKRFISQAKLILLLWFTLGLLANSFAQTCIEESDVRRPWTNIPKFDGDNSYIKIGKNGTGNVVDWLEGSFSIDMWVKCTWNTDPVHADSKYFIFGCGDFSDDGYESFYVYFDKDDDDWRIRISDGTNDNTQPDIKYDINYSSDFYNKWRHITVIYRSLYNDVKLYIDGNWKLTESFQINNISNNFYCYVGGTRGYHSKDFNGYISGFRLWNTWLSDSEEEYIWNKTFDGEHTMKSNYAYLHQNLKVNMFTASDNIYSKVYGVWMSETGLQIHTDQYHPAGPVNAYNGSVDIEFAKIKLDWSSNSSYHTHFVYRRTNEGGWNLLCRTNDSYFVDDDDELEVGPNYDYKIETYWYNPDRNLKLKSDENIILSDNYLNEYAEVSGLVITEDASSSNTCSGTIKLKWDYVTVPSSPPSYTLQAKVSGESWQVLDNNITANQYIHYVDADDLGKEIKYRIDANGDGYNNWSSEKTGTANTECTTAPTNVAAIADGDVFNVTWDFTQQGAPATGFRIYRKEGSGSFEVLADGIAADDRLYTDYAESCIDYQYKVEAYNQCGANGSLSSESEVVYKEMNFGNIFTYLSGSDLYFDASKGYYNDKVILEWAINPSKVADVDAIEIYRKKANQNYSLLATIDNANATSYEDASTEANVFYEYLIRALGTCSSAQLISDSLKTTGFRYSSGIVSGKVTYAGGNAVENVEVRISSDANISASSLYFNGINQLAGSISFDNDSILYKPFCYESWIKPKSMMTGERNRIFMLGYGHFYVGLQNMKPIAVITENGLACEGQTENPIMQAEADTTLSADTWYHIAVTVDPNEGRLKIYLNGEEVASESANMQIPWIASNNPEESCNPQEEVLVVGGGFFPNLMYKGNIDEIRLWTKLRSAEEIHRDYTRILSGQEDGLIGYYNLDENYGSWFYDRSNVDNVFNKNDFFLLDISTGETLTDVDWSVEIPSFEQLHPSGVTNENGNYIIKGVRYIGSGNTFTVSPFLGVHEFTPVDQVIFIGDGSPVHNNIDFVDKSAFRFTGSVYYSGTNFPVEDADIYIDNTQLFDAGGNPVRTNQFGQIDISVPIGQHFITVKKDGHTFKNNGQWPTPTENQPYLTHNFQDDIQSITFYDETTVKLAGRFVGGDVEGDKTIGFNLSKANIGQAQIVLKNEAGYDINPDPEIVSDRIELTTSSLSGEYEIDLVPGVYKIDSVWNEHYQMDNLELGSIDLREVPEVTVEKDTVYTSEILDGDTIQHTEVNDYEYHYLRNFIYYVEPTIHLFGENNEDLHGEAYYYYTHPETEETDTISLLDNSPFNYPVFVMGNTYDIDIQVLSVYANYDNSEVEYDTVPVKDAQVSITNNLEINEPTYSFTTNTLGKLSDYTSFKVGLPNMNMSANDQTSFTKTMTITAQAGNYNIAWNGGDVYRAYVLGGVDAGGVNYVTYGPEIPRFVLHDPPGDRSYTMLEQGSSYSVSRNYNFNSGGEGLYDTKVMRGVKFELGGGLAGPVISSEVTSDLNVGISTKSWVGKNGDFIKEYTFNQTFSTSSEPNAVGSMADVYIGESENLFFTETENLRIYPQSYCNSSGLDYLENGELADSTVGYSIGKRPGFAITDDPSSTFFVYSQDHILNTLLPSYRDLIYMLLSTPKYESKIPAEHLYYGFSNDNPIWADTIALTGDTLPSYVFNGEQNEVDSVAFLNQQISIWLQTIALNEAAKFNYESDEVENISFDGNSGAYTNSVEKTLSSTFNKEYFYRFELFGGSATGFSLNRTGLVTASQTHKDFEQTIGQSDSESKSLKWTYVIDDSNQGDYYSIDVISYHQSRFVDNKESFLSSNNFDDPGYNMGHLGLASGAVGLGSALVSTALSKLVNPLAGHVFGMAKTIATSAAYMGVMAHYSLDTYHERVYYGLQGSSPIFRIMGGQSSCPYEGEEYTIFYIDSVSHEPYLLHPGTQNHEAPKIEIEPTNMVNVPDGSAATFDLRLMNESPTGADITYQLWMDETSNPDGAIIKIDGLNPNRPFFVPAGQTLNKTLTVERGASGAMDFEDLRLIFHSSCQYDPDDNFPDIADSVSFSAHFIPACTEVDFANVEDNWVINVYNNNTKPLTISGYNINLPTFEKIFVQYQQTGTTPTTFMTLYNDTVNTDWAEFTGAKIFINGQASVSFDWDVSALTDGDYTLFLTTTCSDGSLYESEHLNGTIDRITPRPFGTPNPSDGILSYGEDISVLFNENINTGQLYNFGQYGTESYIKVRGMLNGTDLIDNPTILHDASVHFDGTNDYLKMDNINLDHSDFSFEFWAKRNGTGRECLLSIGDLWFGFDETNHVVAEIDGQTMVSDNTYATPEEWMFFSLAYTRGSEAIEPQMKMQILAGADGEPEVLELDLYSSLEGSLYVGYCPDDASAFYGNIHEFRIWNYYRGTTEIAAQKGQFLNGYEEGLYGLWPLNEANGQYAKDLAFGRNAEVHATWQVSRNGKALDLQGSNYFAIPTASMAFSEQSNFTVEFWYKLETPATDVELLSNGFFENDFNQHGWNITATANQEIVISNNGNHVNIPASDYLNDDWHHFAMSLNRIGYLNVYMDGNLIKTENPLNFKGFGASQVVMGARWYNLSMVDHYDRYMNGKIDEVRFWNSARTQNQIQRYMNHTLTGDEPGLKGYFPFEDVSIEDPSISNQSANNFAIDTIGVAGNGMLDAEYYTYESPNMKLQRPEVLIPHNIVLSDNGLIIMTNIEDAQIEHQILDISVERVKDLNGNVMASTLSWTAFIDKNNVVWEMQNLDIEQTVGEETTVSVNIRNKSGLNEAFEVTNIPSWLEVNPSSGSLEPLEVKEIQITVKPELNIGTYQRSLNLVSSLGYNEGLDLSVRVNGFAPDWTINPEDYLYTANVIGQLSIANTLSTDTGDIVACFVGDECRGLTKVKYFADADLYLCFMSIYANENGENMSFKVYDASTGSIYANVTPILTFNTGGLYGSVSNPLPINATNYIDQAFTLNAGWNWLSFNVYANEFNDLNTCLDNLTTHPGDFLKSQSAFSVVSPTNDWQGSLNALDVVSSYKLNVNQAQSFSVSGYRVVADTVQIPIVAGWNWIGYPLSIQKPLMEALSSLNPSENDLIKSQHQFAVYSDILGWVGSLTYMQPGKGYILHSSSDGVLEYSSSILSKSPGAKNSKETACLPATRDNMTIIAELNLDNPELYDVIAYDANGMCAKAKPIIFKDGSVRFFITLNSVAEETIRFKAQTREKGLFAKEIVVFKGNEMKGSLLSPMMLNFDKKETSVFTQVYPNPFREEVYLNLYLNDAQQIQLSLYSSLGRELASTNIALSKGSHRLNLIQEFGLKQRLNEGVYMLKVKYKDEEEFIKIVKH